MFKSIMRFLFNPASHSHPDAYNLLFCERCVIWSGQCEYAFSPPPGQEWNYSHISLHSPSVIILNDKVLPAL